MARKPNEKMIDRLLTLYVIDRCRTKHGITQISETKMHKLMFYSEKKLNESRCKSLNYLFVKLLYPTFSAELRKDLNELVRLNFLSAHPYFSEKQKTQMILEDFHEVFSNNQETMDIINSEVDRNAPIKTEDLVKKTKKMRWRNGIIEKLKNGTPLVYPLKLKKARCVFKISKEDHEDLAICLSPTISEGMAEAFNELRRGKRLSHAEVFR